MRRLSRARASTAKFSGEQRPEFQYPSPHRFVGDIQSALGEQILDVAIPERETQIEPNACRMIAGGNWWRANEIVRRHLNRQPDARYRSRGNAPAQPFPEPRRAPPRPPLLRLPPHQMLTDSPSLPLPLGSRRGGGWNWVGVVSGLFNTNNSGVGALERRPRHDKGYHEGGGCRRRGFAFR